MLIIRKEQTQAFAAYSESEFRRDMSSHLQDFAPELFAIVGADGFSKFIDLGLVKARRYGMTLHGCVRHLLDVMCLLGQDFDRDPQYRRLWPEGDPAAMPMAFSERLHGNVRAYFDQCIGPDQALLADAIEAMLRAPLVPSGDVDAFVRETVRAIYPQKYAFIGEENLGDFFARCREVAASARLASAEGYTTVVLLALCIGSEFLENPLYPWVAARLSTDAPEEERLARTQFALRAYGEATVKNFRRR